MLLILLFILVPGLALAEDLKGVELVSVHDGDTIMVDVANVPAILGARLPVRLKGVDTPELNGKCEAEKTQALLAKNVLMTLLTQARKIQLAEISRDKFFRVDAIVMADGVNLNTYLVQQGFARPYDGGTRKGWCP